MPALAWAPFRYPPSERGTLLALREIGFLLVLRQFPLEDRYSSPRILLPRLLAVARSCDHVHLWSGLLHYLQDFRARSPKAEFLGSPYRLLYLLHLALVSPSQSPLH